jgi:hypothetical protein
MRNNCCYDVDRNKFNSMEVTEYEEYLQGSRSEASELKLCKVMAGHSTQPGEVEENELSKYMKTAEQ